MLTKHAFKTELTKLEFKALKLPAQLKQLPYEKSLKIVSVINYRKQTKFISKSHWIYNFFYLHLRIFPIQLQLHPTTSNYKTFNYEKFQNNILLPLARQTHLLAFFFLFFSFFLAPLQSSVLLPSHKSADLIQISFFINCSKYSCWHWWKW